MCFLISRQKSIEEHNAPDEIPSGNENHMYTPLDVIQPSPAEFNVKLETKNIGRDWQSSINNVQHFELTESMSADDISSLFTSLRYVRMLLKMFRPHFVVIYLQSSGFNFCDYKQ